MGGNGKPRLWLTYAWSDNSEGDFDYLVQLLQSGGIDAQFDRVALVPGQRLWSQIGDRIAKDPLDGWAFLVTVRSLASQPCLEELGYALDRALSARGDNFPIIGLLHGVSAQDLPPALKSRLCISLKDPDWIERVKAALARRAPQITLRRQSAYVVRIHSSYQGMPGCTAIEIRPRLGEITNWRFVLPAETEVVQMGRGSVGGGALLPVATGILSGAPGTTPDGEAVKVWGEGDAIGPNLSAYLVIKGILPERLLFGWAPNPLELNIVDQEVFEITR